MPIFMHIAAERDRVQTLIPDGLPSTSNNYTTNTHSLHSSVSTLQGAQILAFYPLSFSHTSLNATLSNTSTLTCSCLFVMDRLPPELLHNILLWSVRQNRCDKNKLLSLRLVCSAFDSVLRPYIFKTFQLEFSRFAQRDAVLQYKGMENVGELCEALYCDLMVIRDEEEIDRLLQVFNSIIPKVPEMTTLLDSLRQYCMNEDTFDEHDFRRVVMGVLAITPNMVRLKLNLPFQVIGHASRTATLLLATTFACFKDRGDSIQSFKPLQTLVLDHVSDSTLLDICRNPFDLTNAINTFKTLKHLVLSLKRQESSSPLMSVFSSRLWLLLSKAVQLENLCLIGWNTKRLVGSRRHRASMHLNEWLMKSLPYHGLDAPDRLKRLRCLELKRVDIEPTALVNLIEQNSASLKELYLNEVYLKVMAVVNEDKECLWIGHGSITEKPKQSLWMAHRLREMDLLHLDILRASGLGYDIYDPDRVDVDNEYDLLDPSAPDRPFDQRFVATYLGVPQLVPKVEALTGSPDSPTAGEAVVRPIPVGGMNSSPPTGLWWDRSPSYSHERRRSEYDVEAYQRFHHNSTSHWKRCIDGFFYNHNEKALSELQKIIGVADRGMSLLSDEIDRIHAMTRIPQQDP
ncbi:MAG: hypothetical protein M1818_005469 [Claussenomyces sp. TS43310]|nr:MAG: hypothetical protein M1818_005469 [Claussenomyces sp. TS43310]